MYIYMYVQPSKTIYISYLGIESDFLSSSGGYLFELSMK